MYLVLYKIIVTLIFCLIIIFWMFWLLTPLAGMILLWKWHQRMLCFQWSFKRELWFVLMSSQQENNVIDYVYFFVVFLLLCCILSMFQDVSFWEAKTDQFWWHKKGGIGSTTWWQGSVFLSTWCLFSNRVNAKSHSFPHFVS